MNKIKYEQVRAGSFFVNEKKGSVREIIGATGGGYFDWLSYSYPGGQSIVDNGNCSAQYIAQWATREATEEEVAKLGRDKAHSQYSAQQVERVHDFLRAIPDALLLAEVNRRGLSVAPQKQ